MMHCKKIRPGVDAMMTFGPNGNQIRRKILSISTRTLSAIPKRRSYFTQGRSETSLYQRARFLASCIHCQNPHRRFSTTSSTISEQPDEQQQQTTDTFVLLSASVQVKLVSSIRRYNEIMEEMKSGKVVSHGMQQELSSLSEAYKVYQHHQALQQEEQSYIKLMEELKQDSSSPDPSDENSEILDDFEAEIRRIYNEKLQCEGKLVDAILPKDIEDTTYDAIIEIRAGTGGDEASLFAREIWDCYIKSIKTISKQWKVDVLTETTTDLGGLRDGSFLITGNTISIELDSPENIVNGSNNGEDTIHNKTSDNDSVPTGKVITEEIGPYGFFKYESGVHRVQRIPINATRIHTSACSIAVLPSIKDDAIDKKELLPMSELKIETMRAHGAGGQHINTTDSAVRITHIPTGLQAAIQDERSQHKNKEKALKLITARVRDLKRIEQEQQLGQQRTQLLGGGDRSERIRTYNYPQDRITDHRCKVSIQNISSLLSCQNHSLQDGLVISFLPYLKMMRREELLQQLEE